ncbi:hypothetical protein B0H17DRAFT_1147834 [Mycena rosella]|uniref:AMP-dependent synthetase/ligase domain-containing protein n=1 Tax=Mycena rosella TaxID=1033263 RepID=A0AAD7CHD9_MYCRO|nr:hypothetical protein B0H17DRAFT_1147834 [Mycena rosella]
MPPHDKSSTFHPAPLSSNLSIPELYQYHALNSPKHPVFAYSDTNARTSTTICYQEAWTCIQTTACIISEHMARVPIIPGKERPVIAIMAQSDTMSHIYSILAIMALGYVAFPMSPRNDAQTAANLLKATGVQYMLVDTGGSIHALARDAVQTLQKFGDEIG